MYCKDCTHWKPVPSYYVNQEKLKGGTCLNPLITEDYGDYPENALVYSYLEGGSFWTGRLFGCINFKEKL